MSDHVAPPDRPERRPPWVEEQLTRGTGWKAMRYDAISKTMERLATYCAVCDCKSLAPIKDQAHR